MREAEFLKVFDFEYTVIQWEQIERVIDTQPGSPNKKKLRDKLELLARQYRLVPQLEAHVPRQANLTQANEVVKCCKRLRTLLSEANVRREGSFHTAFNPVTNMLPLSIRSSSWKTRRGWSRQTTGRFPKNEDRLTNGATRTWQRCVTCG